MKQFLFLQGPQGPFFRELGAALSTAGHGVQRVNFHGGDVHDWPAGRAYRGRADDWPAAAARLIAEQRISDLVVYGDCRPLHRAAIAAARKAGAAVHVFEEAYFRPGYMTLERGGVNGHSALPQRAESVRRAAREIGAVPAPFVSSVRRSAEAVRYYTRAHVSKMALQFPHISWHRGRAPLTEGLGYVKRHFLRGGEERASAAARAAVRGQRYFILPLQLDRDFQLRTHSDAGSMQGALAQILSDFARNAPANVQLLVKRHPLDNGLVDWRRLTDAPRVHFTADGDLHTLLEGAEGLVTVNSTAALPALARGLPVKALGRAIYDMQGLTDQQPLRAFWRCPAPPDMALFAAFRSMVIACAQVPGDPGCAAGRAVLVQASMRRMLSPDAATLARAA